MKSGIGSVFSEVKMTLKEYLKANGISVLKLHKMTGIPYTTINDIVDRKTDIDKARVDILIRLSRSLDMPIDVFYNLAKALTPTPKLDDGYKIEMSKGKYYIIYNNTKQYLCRNTDTNAVFIEDIAKTYIGNQQRKERMESWMTKI